MNRIESSSNPIIKQTKKLLTSSGRKKQGLFILEGERLVADSLKLGAEVQYILASESFGNVDFANNIKVYTVSDKIFDELKSTVNSQGILAVAKYSFANLAQIDLKRGLYLYLDCVADPGNMGTIIRSANAFGADGIILSKGCADVFNPKVLRSTMSGIFKVSIYQDDETLLSKLAENRFDILGTFPKGDFSSGEFSYGDKCVIVMGNEANGISAETERFCTHKITIPMTNNAESLNVSVACGIMLYEAYISRK